MGLSRKKRMNFIELCETAGNYSNLLLEVRQKLFANIPLSIPTGGVSPRRIKSPGRSHYKRNKMVARTTKVGYY